MNVPISIIITTIGEKILEKNLDNLINNQIKFDEIIVVIPKIYKKDTYKKYDENNNIKFLYTDFKGQVNQRIYGFKNAKSEFVLQLDCDCIIDPNHIFNLYYYLKRMKEKNGAIAPVYYSDKSKLAIHRLDNNFKNLIKNIITYIICGSKFGIFKMGTISRIGNNYGVDPKYMFNEIFETDWLPGGCILHYKKNLYLNNYYPFTGKAYCEDLIHSYFLRNNKIRLYVLKKSHCFTEIPYLPSSFEELKKYLNVQKYFTKILNNKIHIGFYIWMLLTYFRYFFTR